MTIRPGELWVADIPFTDGKSIKRRPILVLWLDGEDIVVAAVTSAPAQRLTLPSPVGAKAVCAFLQPFAYPGSTALNNPYSSGD